MILSFIKKPTLLLRKLYRFLFFYERWNIGIVDKPIYAFLTSDDIIPQVRWLPELPHNKFIADPFAIHYNGNIYIFFEDYDYYICKGCISAMSINGNFSQFFKAIINPSFHTSYPYLLEYKDEIYCIPETHQANEVSLYNAEKFPDKWVKVTTLIKDFAGVDNTVFQHDGHWWLMAVDGNDSLLNKLSIWHAPDLLGQWEPHAGNPVKVDIRSARPAGTPFVYNGQLYRPSQDCSSTYGERIILNRVIRLTDTEFEEEQAAIIAPYKNSPYPDGLHTISALGDMTIIDGKKYVFIGGNLFILKHKIKNFIQEIKSRNIIK